MSAVVNKTTDDLDAVLLDKEFLKMNEIRSRLRNFTRLAYTKTFVKMCQTAGWKDVSVKGTCLKMNRECSKFGRTNRAQEKVSVGWYFVGILGREV